MYTAPQLHASDLNDLIVLVGGDRSACALLDITPRTLRRWRCGAYPTPQMALKLLWFAGPWGRQAADIDLFNEVKLLRTLVNAVDRQSKRPLEADQFVERLKAASPAAAPLALAETAPSRAES